MWSVTKEHQLGAIVGALVGDAAGATLEFCKNKTLTDEDACNAMRMLGGGMLNMGPGQITDDGELTLALTSALSKHTYTERLPIKDIASAYTEWMFSNPFDSGMTCRRAFTTLRNSPILKDAVQDIASANAESQANGALMRATPIGAFYHKHAYSVIGAYAKMDARLSHPNPVCQDANAVYCVAIADLINFPRDNHGVMITVDEFIKASHIHPTVVSWLKDSKKMSLNEIDCTKNIGHVKHALTLAFYFLQKGVSYEEAIRETLKKGGDTDSNACIVGGLMGALHGFTAIPEDMRDAVLDFDCVKHDPWQSLMGYNRPERYKALNAYNFVMGWRE